MRLGVVLLLACLLASAGCLRELRPICREQDCSYGTAPRGVATFETPWDVERIAAAFRAMGENAVVFDDRSTVWTHPAKGEHTLYAHAPCVPREPSCAEGEGAWTLAVHGNDMEMGYARVELPEACARMWDDERARFHDLVRRFEEALGATHVGELREECAEAIA